MKNDEWLTPPEIIKVLGQFDLDPCSPIKRPWDTALNHYSVIDDGLSKKWFGRVWLNPPYGEETKKWLELMVQHGDGIALIFARTETKTFFKYVWPCADALLFLRGRLFFRYIDGSIAKNNSGAPSVLIAYGQRNSEILMGSGLAGKFIKLTPEENQQQQLGLFN